MYGLLFGMIGLALGTLAGLLIGARYIRAENLQAQIDDTQARMLSTMGEMRSALDETRQHVRGVWASATGGAPESGGSQEAGPLSGGAAEGSGPDDLARV